MAALYITTNTFEYYLNIYEQVKEGYRILSAYGNIINGHKTDAKCIQAQTDNNLELPTEWALCSKWSSPPSFQMQGVLFYVRMRCDGMKNDCPCKIIFALNCMIIAKIPYHFTEKRGQFPTHTADVQFYIQAKHI